MTHILRRALRTGKATLTQLFNSIAAMVLLTVPPFAEAQRPAEPAVLFFGDSLTAGYNIAKEDAYPARIEALARAENIPIRAVNGGLSGEASAGALRRIDWYLKQPFDVVVIAVGANDGLRGLSVQEMKQNLNGIIEKVRNKLPSAVIILAGMRLPPTFGKEYEAQFSSAFAEVARTAKVPLFPFLLEDVAGERDLNLPDGLHPNEKGHAVVASKLWSFLETHTALRKG